MRSRLYFAIAACLLAYVWTSGPVVAQAAGRTEQKHQTAGSPRYLTEEQMIFQSNKLGELGVYNDANRDVKLGALDNLIIDAHQGRVLYGILDTGLWGKKIPVPWTALHVVKTGKQYFLALTKSKEQLANAPTIDMKHMPDFMDAAWQRNVDNFFGVRTAARSLSANPSGVSR